MLKRSSRHLALRQRMEQARDYDGIATSGVKTKVRMKGNEISNRANVPQMLTQASRERQEHEGTIEKTALGKATRKG